MIFEYQDREWQKEQLKGVEGGCPLITTPQAISY